MTALAPPHDLDAEAGVIGALMLAQAPTDQVRAIVSAGDFYQPAHQRVFEAICSLDDQQRMADPVTTADALGPDGPSLGELIALQAGAPAPSSAPAYARIVAEKARDRRVIAISLELGKAAQEGRLEHVLPGALRRLGDLGVAGGVPELVIEDAATVAARVSSNGAAHWLACPVWPADAYGVLAAEKKVGKTWMALDLAVAVASGSSWLGTYPIETSGPVLVFLGEGGERKMVRRLRALCAAKGACLDDLPVRLCHRAPTLSSAAHLEEVRREVQRSRPALVVIDPLYLSAAGAKSADLYSMGAVLASIQAISQEAGAALLVVTHWNKTGEGHGAHRMTGAGPAEWGRVLVSVGVEHRATNPDRSTVATLRLTFEGDEIPETELRLRRRVWAEDPDDLASPLHYQVEALAGPATEGSPDGMRPADRRVLAVLSTDDGWLGVREIGDRLAVDGTGFAPLRARTIQASLKALTGAGLARSASIGSGAGKWRAQEPEAEAENAF